MGLTQVNQIQKSETPQIIQQVANIFALCVLLYRRLDLGL